VNTYHLFIPQKIIIVPQGSKVFQQQRKKAKKFVPFQRLNGTPGFDSARFVHTHTHTHTQLALANLIPNFSTTLTALAGEGRLASPFAFLPVLALFPVEERGFFVCVSFLRGFP